jgi:hypothetical protein
MGIYLAPVSDLQLRSLMAEPEPDDLEGPEAVAPDAGVDHGVQGVDAPPTGTCSS